MGALYSTPSLWTEFREVYPPKPRFRVDDVPDLTGKIALVTGGNTGIGKLTCKYLLRRNAKVYMACRSEEKAMETIKELKAVTGKDALHFLKLDLADLQSVYKAAQDYQKQESTLHMLFNSAGVFLAPNELLTKQGYDLSFGTNVIGHGYFTMLLLPTLIATAKADPEGKVRVINVASNAHAHAPVGGIDWDTVTASVQRLKKVTPVFTYMQSKWGNIAFSNELAKRYGEQGIVSTALNPGSVRTDVNRHATSFQRWILENIVQWDADPLGALTSLYAGTSPETLEMNGGYFWPWARVGVPRPDTKDPKLTARLWHYIEDEGRKSRLENL